MPMWLTASPTGRHAYTVDMAGEGGVGQKPVLSFCRTHPVTFFFFRKVFSRRVNWDAEGGRQHETHTHAGCRRSGALLHGGAPWWRAGLSRRAQLTAILAGVAAPPAANTVHAPNMDLPPT